MANVSLAIATVYCYNGSMQNNCAYCTKQYVADRKQSRYCSLSCAGKAHGFRKGHSPWNAGNGGYDSQLYQSPIYYAWASLKSRCTNHSARAFQRYGGRGITYCGKWETFVGFLEDMQESYQDGMTLDRTDNNGPYSKENCQWVDRTAQANNRSTTRYFTIGGETKTLSQWIKESGIKSSTVRQRFYSYKWPIEKALGKEGHIG